MNDIVSALKALSLHGMASAWPMKALDHEAVLHQLLKVEAAQRGVRSMAYQVRVARFPSHRDLTGFDFGQASVDEGLVRELHQLKFVDSAHNVVLIGGPGTGKTHLATSLGVQAIRHHGKRVRFFSTVELVNALEQEKAQGKQGQLQSRPPTDRQIGGSDLVRKLAHFDSGINTKSLSDDVIRVVEMDPQQMLVSVPMLGTRLCVLSRCWPEPGGGPTVSQAIRLSRIPLIAES